MVKKRPRRLQIEISADLERKLILWAASRDMKLNPWVKLILRMRADDHWPKIQADLRERAKRLDMTFEDLEQKLLVQNGFDFERERTEFENDLYDHEEYEE